ncbi:MAG TPA: DHH family phosphoesterase [Clostridia bacterium]|nr:DHH family phosphoesterase [Clostridia bacterium]
MRGKKVWNLGAPVFLALGVLLIVSALSLFWDFRIFLAEIIACLVVFAFTLLKMRNIHRNIRAMLVRTAEKLSPADRESLSVFPLPAVVVGKKGEVMWYNDRFRNYVLNRKDAYGTYIRSIARGLSVEAFDKPGGTAEATVDSRKFTVYGSLAPAGGFYTLYWVDNSELKNTALEYHESRPVVAIVMIDNYDELMQNAKEGEKADILSRVEKQLMAWVSTTTGFLWHSDRDKYIFVFEERHYRKIVEERFDILDKVRQIIAGERMPATLSIGVGRGGKSLAENEEMARQALDMALGRGGDQSAVKTRDGYEFYGGISKAVEKRTKVKTRIIASALAELIEGSENVLIMGHKNSDLDVVGACVGIYRSVVSRGIFAKIVINRRSSMAAEFISELEGRGYGEAFIDPEDSLLLVSKKTLLIIVDTHRKAFVDSPELYQNVKTVVVIDHHRKMVDYIDNAVIFHHEPYASSASEMVSELVQYLADSSLTSVEADAMLAGITLDTRNFTVRTGVRTFEAAAYLRRKGADTVRVKQLFAGSMENYRKRSKLVSSAEIYHGCAISRYDGDPDDSLKFVTPQAADELLTITGVSASMVAYPAGSGVAISARSMGEINVQLIMETLGGGGHLTMAGAQMDNITMAEAVHRIKEAVDRYFAENG